MIDTIKIPHNLRQINERLPTPNYFPTPPKKLARPVSLPALVPLHPKSSRAEARRNNVKVCEIFGETLNRAVSRENPQVKVGTPAQGVRPPLVPKPSKENLLPPLPNKPG